MPPSRSTKDPVRFDPSTTESHPHRGRTRQPVEVIVISSDEDDDDDDDDDNIIIISDDDADAEGVSQMTEIVKKPTPVSRMSPHNRRATPGTQATPKERAIPASTSRRPITVARILAGDFGDPKTWTFGLPERNFMDIEKVVEETRPYLKGLSGAELVAKIAYLRAVDPKVHGAHPDKNDRTVRYTHVERYPGGPIWFTIRWWDGKNLGHFFDLVDVATQKLFLPHRDLPDLFVQVEFLGGMMPVCTMEEAMRRSRGVRKIPGANYDERYNAPAGARTLFSRVPVADVYSPRFRQPAPLGPQPPTLSPFGS